MSLETAIANGAAVRWLLLIHQLPAKPAYLRVKTWRKLQSIGAVAIKNAVYALPATEQTQEDLEWLRREIEQAGGEAMICEARLINGLTDADVRALFNAARDDDYTEIADELRALNARVDKGHAESPEELRALFKRLKSRHALNVAIDFFGASGREVSNGLIGALETGLRESGVEEQDSSPDSPMTNLTGRIWVTRQGVHVDRIACSWLIRKFIDPTASIKFILPREYQHTPGELRFDMFDGEFTHEGDRCSFEVLMARAELDDPALAAIGEIVHDIDLKEDKFGREETAGVKALINGICGGTHDDEQRIARGGAILDDLYAGFQRKPVRQRERKVSQESRPRAAAGKTR
jgi:hypothetical protein